MTYLTTTGALPEPYRTTTTGNGREGIKEGKGREVCGDFTIHRPVSDARVRDEMDGATRFVGGVR